MFLPWVVGLQANYFMQSGVRALRNHARWKGRFVSDFLRQIGLFLFRINFRFVGIRAHGQFVSSLPAVPKGVRVLHADGAGVSAGYQCGGRAGSVKHGGTGKPVVARRTRNAL